MLSEEEQKENTEVVEISENQSPEMSIHSGNSKDDEDVEPQETEELMAKGGISKSLYWKYFRAGGSILMILSFVVTLILGQTGSSGCDYWVAYWSVFKRVPYFQRKLYNLIYFLRSQDKARRGIHKEC